MYFDEFSLLDRQEKCFNYFDQHEIINRDQLRELIKREPIDGVTVRFAEEMLVDYLELKRKIDKTKKEIKFKDSKRVTAVVINDLHIPYHDEKAVNLVFDCIIDIQPQYLILNGDILDFYGCSKFEKKPDRFIMLQEEIDIFYRKFKNLRKSIPNTEIHYNLGNHEQRMTKIMMANPGLYNLDVLTPETLLKLDKLDIISHKNKFTLNGFIFYHGDVVRKESSYSAKEEYIQHNSQTGMSAHTHRLGTYYHTYDKNVGYWYENGCLCTLEPEYFKDPTKANWQHGFSIVEFYDDIIQTNQILIQDYKFIYNNKKYC